MHVFGTRFVRMLASAIVWSVAAMAGAGAADDVAATAREGRPLVLENDVVKVTFWQPGLCLRSVEFRQRPNLRLFPDPPLETPLYRIKLRGPAGRSEEIRSLEASSVTVRRPMEDRRSHWVLEASHGGPIDKVSVHVALDDSGFVDLRLEPGQAAAGWTIREVVFPQVATRGMLSDVVHETFVGGERPRPLRPDWRLPSGRYPVSPRIPLLYQYGPQGGLYLMTLDPDRWVKTTSMTAELDPGGKTLRAIVWRFGVEMAPSDPTPRYTARLGLIQDSAYEAAEVYRDWAMRQPWRPLRLSEREDIAAWRLRGVPHYFLYQADERPAGPDDDAGEPRVRTLDELEKTRQTSFTLREIPAVIESLPKEITELGGVIDLRGWEKWGLWTSPDWWLPRQGEAALRQAIQAIHKAGLHVTTDVQFNELDLHRAEGDHGGLGDEGRRIIESRGMIVEDVAITNERGEATWWGPAVDRCNFACPNVPAVFRDVAWTLARMREAGFDEVQFDGGGWTLDKECWNSKHGHAPGPGLWQTADAADYYERLRDAIPGARQSAFGFIEEYCNELRLGSYAAVYTRCEQDLMRDGTTRALEGLVDRRLPTPRPDMFSFVYHGRMIETGFFWEHGPTAYHAAANATLGVCAGPQGTPWLDFRRSLDAPWMKIFIAGVKARETFARKYLLLGQMLRPMSVAPLAPLKVYLRDAATREWTQQELVASAVVQQAYRADDGQIGWILVNRTNEPVTCVPQPPLPPWFAELSSAPMMRKTTVDGAQRFSRDELREFALGPAEVVLLEQD